MKTAQQERGAVDDDWTAEDLATALTIREYATRMRMSEAGVRSDIRRGGLKVIRTSPRRTYIPRSEYLRKCAELGLQPY